MLRRRKRSNAEAFLRALTANGSKGFDPGQARDDDGKWSVGSAGLSHGAVSDLHKLVGRHAETLSDNALELSDHHDTLDSDADNVKDAEDELASEKKDLEEAQSGLAKATADRDEAEKALDSTAAEVGVSADAEGNYNWDVLSEEQDDRLSEKLDTFNDFAEQVNSLHDEVDSAEEYVAEKQEALRDVQKGVQDTLTQTHASLRNLADNSAKALSEFQDRMHKAGLSSVEAPPKRIGESGERFLRAITSHPVVK